jgi:hypothetical protein
MRCKLNLSLELQILVELQELKILELLLVHDRLFKS